MKKIVLCLMVVFFSLAFVPLQSKAATTEEPSSLTAPKPAESTDQNFCGWERSDRIPALALMDQ